MAFVVRNMLFNSMLNEVMITYANRNALIDKNMSFFLLQFIFNFRNNKKEMRENVLLQIVTTTTTKKPMLFMVDRKFYFELVNKRFFFLGLEHNNKCN